MNISKIFIVAALFCAVMIASSSAQASLEIGTVGYLTDIGGVYSDGNKSSAFMRKIFLGYTRDTRIPISSGWPAKPTLQSSCFLADLTSK